VSKHKPTLDAPWRSVATLKESAELTKLDTYMDWLDAMKTDVSDQRGYLIRRLETRYKYRVKNGISLDAPLKGTQ